MKLNLYDILQTVLNESVGQNEVTDAIDNRYRVFIDYSDEFNRAPGQRLIEPYCLGITKAGNPALRAYEYQGATLRGIPKWKLFRLDRITKWRPLRNSTFNLQPSEQGWPAPPYNENGDKTLIAIIDQVKFDNNNDGLYQPTLDRLRKQTDQLVNHSNAIDMTKLKDVPRGPIRQRRNNIYTSRPTSKQYAMFRKNVADSERDAEELKNYWGDYDKAEQEMNNNNILNHENDDLNNIRGPITNYDEDDYDDFDDYGYDYGYDKRNKRRR